MLEMHAKQPEDIKDKDEYGLSNLKEKMLKREKKEAFFN